ncbi:MAG TPA: hypothetical protein VKA49_14550 [Flavitalea sp.]|nr:hypothetical protein [Flavitalea sp.]
MKNWIRRYQIVILIGLGILAVAATYGFKEYNRKLPDTHQLKADFQIEAVDFVRQFEADGSSATTQYSDKVIDVQGFVSSVEVTDTSGTVFLNGGSSKSSVMCEFGQKTFQEIKELRIGERIIIKGVCTGYLMDVVMVRCVLTDKTSVFPELVFFAALF